VFLDPTLFSSTTTAYTFFEFIYEKFLKNAYTEFKYKYPNFGPGHFTKSEKHYYSHVIREVIVNTKNNWNAQEYKEFFNTYYISEEGVKLSVSSPEDVSIKLGLIEELKDYRTRMYKAKGIKPYEVYTNKQMNSIAFNKPKNINELKLIPKFKYNQIEEFGEEILKIVAKYLID
jgi:superfamily II DNA helicase RecQ